MASALTTQHTHESAARRISVYASQLSQQACSAQAPVALLAGKVAIITGSGKGIGAAAAMQFAAQGAAVVVCDLDADAAKGVADSIQKAGGKAIAIAPADVTKPETPAEIVGGAMKAFGRLDFLINNAGFTWDGVIQKMTPEQWDTMLLVHCTAPFRLIQAAAPYMRDAAKQEMQNGPPSPRCIINISSTTGTHGNAGQTNYATAKAGVIGLTKSVAKEWGPFGIRCNAISFGLIETRLTQPKEQGEVLQVGGKAVPLGIPKASSYWTQVKAAIPLRRGGSPNEAASTILMLCTPWASYVTGQVLEVNGGAFM